MDIFAPVTFVKTNGIMLSGRSRALRRKYHAALRKRHRNRMAGTWLPFMRMIESEVCLLRQMMLNSIGNDLGTHYQNEMANTFSTRRVHKTIVTHTGYRKRMRCPNVLFDSGDKSTSLTGSEEIAKGFRDRFASNHRLSTDMHSPYDSDVHDYVKDIDRPTITIMFNDNMRADIEDWSELNELNERLPSNRRDLLTCGSEVCDIISAAPPKRSSGPDSMPYFLIKHFSPSVILFLTVLFNHLLSTSYFPAAWKHSIVTPIPKPNKDPSLIENWRPISNLNCVSKIFERLMARRILRVIDGLEIFETQFGFLRGLSTHHALARLQSAIDRGLNDGKFTTFVSLDLRSAFDTVWHDGLVFKLGRLNFPPTLIKIIHSFLSNRSFSVRVGKLVTDPAPMNSGTPQGSVCSPILFNLYLHDIPTDRDVNTLQFADDTSLFCVGDCAGFVQNAVNLHLVRLGQYFANWKLLLNERKTEMMVVMGFAREAGRSMRKAFRGIKITFNGALLRPVHQLRFLGVIFCRNNRFVRHVDHALAKAGRSYYALRPILRSRLIAPSIKTNVYKMYIRPIIACAATIWARPVSLSSHQMERMRAFERRVLRMTANVQLANWFV